MKTVYLYDEKTHEYIGAYNAQPSPLEKNKYLTPDCSLSISPPTPGANQCAVESNGKWILQEDYRGQTIYDQTSGSAMEVSAIGPVPVGYALTQPLANIKTEQKRAIANAYQETISADITFKTAAGVSKTYQADTTSRDALLSDLVTYTAVGATPAGYYWVSADNTQVPFTLADLQALAQAIGDRKWVAFKKLQTRKASIKKAATVSSVQKIVW